MAMQQSGIYGAQMGLDIEYGSDPAAGGFFNSDYKKHEDLKQMLDSNKDGLKLEAMKRIIGMIARGRDASVLFPAVVKNVVSKNIEVKKLVYVYLVRYAEEQQDLALLSISTFQRALKDPNQLIRASALRVLSSIRVPMIVPIVMLVIRESASDMSPYVRKTAAHAIPKLYSLDAEQKEELVSVIDKLLSDRTTLVVGSAVMAFEEVCPERADLIHKNYRKLCNLLVDVDEWGQVTIINMLTRYARSQFVDPNSKEEELSDGNDSDDNDNRRKSSYNLDSDHRLLLRQAKPLLQSHNASVVMAVSQLYFHIAPRNEIHIIAKALIRLLRSHKEIQSVVLTCIASLSLKHKPVFEPYLKSFFVRTMDPTHIKLLKLDILTNLANTESISIILREFQTYISSSNKAFVGATIQAIGRCAATIKEVTETCLTGLVHLLSNSDEYVIAESVVVIKRLLQEKSLEHFEIISQMAKLLDFITAAAARSAIIWLIGEFNEKVPKIAPDVLRKLAKTFVDEKDIVKLQILNLAVKLYLTNPRQVELLSKYIFNLARYDLNYDIRDRARFLRQFIFPAEDKPSILASHAKRIFLSPKPVPTMESKYHGREKYQLGSLSHYMNMKANGYNNLPEFPEVAPDSGVRNVEGFMNETPQTKEIKKKTFYAESEKNSNTEDGSSSSGSSSSDDESSSSESEGDKKVEKKKVIVNNISKSKKSSGSEESGSEDSDSSSSYSGSSSSSSDEESEKEEPKVEKKVKKDNSNTKNTKNTKKEEPKPKSNLDLLLDLDDFCEGAVGGDPVMPQSTPLSFGGNNVAATRTSDEVELVGPSFLHFKHTELMNKVVGSGLSLGYRFTRLPSLYSSKMVSIEFNIRNESSKDIENVSIATNILPNEMKFSTFDPIDKLAPGESAIKQVGVDFNDSSHAIEFEVSTSNVGKNRLAFKAPLGELIRSVKVSESYFNNERSKLRGMNEHTCNFTNVNHFNSEMICERVFQNLNVACTGKRVNQVRFCGETLASKSLVLISVTASGSDDKALEIVVNCEKMVVGSIILNEMKKCLS